MSMKKVVDKWTEGCQWDLHLRDLFETGQISMTAKPLQVKMQHNDLFKDADATVFRKHFNIIKKLHGIFVC